MKWLFKAWHYLKLIFKKTDIDNAILQYIIDELIDNQKMINWISKELNIDRITIVSILEAIKTEYEW